MQRLPYEAKVEIFKRMGYMPNPTQIAIHRDTSNETLVAGGWRAGKSVVAAGEATPHCLIPAPRAYLIALIGPTYVEPRTEFDYMVEFLSKALPRYQFDPKRHVSRPKEGKCSFVIPPQGEFNFATVETFTAAEAEAIRAFNADGVIICEAGGIEKASWEAILGRTLSTGGFIFGTGTMEASQKWYHDKIKEGLRANDAGVRAFKLPSWSNVAVFPGGEHDEKIERLRGLLDKETFDVRIGAEPIRVSGVALKQMTQDHIQDVEFDPMLPVQLWIDPGHTGAYSVLAIQRYDNQIRVIDEIYERFLSTPQIIEICKERPWWNSIDPAAPGVIDRAAKQKQSATGHSVLDVWFQEAGLWLGMTEAVIPVEDGLEQARIHLGMPGHIAVSPKARGLLAECDLGDFPEMHEHSQAWHYRRGREGDFLGDRALAGADHSCTAFIYGLIYTYGFVTMDEMTKQFGPDRLMSLGGVRQLRGNDMSTDYGPERAAVRMTGAPQ